MRNRPTAWSLGVLLAIAAALPRPLFAQTTALTVDEAVALAMEANPTLRSAALDVEKREHELATARSRRYPSVQVTSLAAQLLTPVSVRFPAGSFGTFPGTGPVPAVDTEVTTGRGPSLYLNAQAMQPLSQLFELGLAVKLSASNIALEQERVRAARISVAFDVRRQYYRVLETGSELEAVEFTVNLLERLLRDVEVRAAQRVVLKADALEVSLRLARAELTRVSLANRLAGEKETLNALLGRDIGTPLDVVASLPASAFSRDREDVRAQALASRPDVRQARVRIDQSVLAERIARADRLPDIALAVNYLSPLSIDGAPTNLASVGVQMTWEPFDWGRKSRVVATRALERRQADLALADAERHALADVHAAHRTLDEAEAALRVARLAQESAREQARVAAAQYQAEAVLLTQVLNTESAVAESNHRYREALSTYWTARAALGRSIGEE